MCEVQSLLRRAVLVGVWVGALASTGCTSGNERHGNPVPLGQPDGVLCGATTCTTGTACCLGDGGCLGIEASGVVACAGEYLTCDGPEDCPGSWCCLHEQPLGAGSVYAACDGQWDDAGIPSCPQGAVASCKSDPQCGYFFLHTCADVEGGALGSPGALKVCVQ